MNGTPMNGTPINGTSVNQASQSGWRDQTDHEEPSGLVDPLAKPESEVWPEVAQDDLESERARLESEIADAKARAASARHRASVRDAEVKTVLRAEIAASKERLTEMEREHEATMASVRETARAEVERILAGARQQAIDLSTQSSSSEQERVDHAE